jgi:hypothetical protein
MSSRNLTTAMDAAIVAGKVRPVIFVEGSFHASGSPDEEFLRLWSGLGDFSWDSKTWTGAGKLLRISPLEESAEVKAVGFNVELSGLPPSLLSLALDNTRQGRPGRVWLGLMGRSGYLNLPGEVNDYASTPDSAAVDVTGDIEMVARVAATDWTPGTFRAIAAKWNDGTQESFIWWLDDSVPGTMAFIYTADGSTNVFRRSTAAVSATDGNFIWLKITRDATTGDIKFYTAASDDLIPDNVVFIQLGTTVASPVGSIFNSNTTLSVGAYLSGGSGVPFDGKIAYFVLRNGIGGSDVAVFDPSTDASQGVKSFTSSATGEVWTINQSGSTRAEIVMNENHLIADPYLLRSGRMDYCNISVSGEDTRITAQYEDRLIDLQKPRERRYTDQDQRNQYPTDGGFRFVTSLQDKQLIWGGPGAAASPIAAPSYADTEYPEDNGRTARSDYD